MHYVDALERLERHIISDMTDDDCWFTDYAPMPNGYVRISLGYYRGYIGIHRMAWEAHNAQPIPPGMYVMHSCDNPGCCNPNHLSIGTPQDNITDKRLKGRCSNGNRQQRIERTARKPRCPHTGRFLPEVT